MPLKLDVERVLIGKSDRVKCVDIHPQEPWILSALYSGHIFIWNYETEVIVRTFEVSEVPVRAAKFVARKHWFVCGTDDMYIRVYNYNTCEKVREFEAHTDYIRSIAIHPTLPFILSASDDMSIKLWDWDRQFENTIIFEGHTHYCMQVEINPKDTNSFASASLDRSVKVWGLNSSVPHFQLESHDRGVNCVSYYMGGERPFLVSGADDHLVKVWDYQTKTCVATLEGHTANISSVMFHPQLPIIISGSEDGSIKIWHSNTYRLETTLHYGMERVWTMACMLSSNKVAIGFDEGTIMIKLGQEEPVVSMDNSGKVIWAKNHEIQLSKVLKIKSSSLVDGEPLPIAPDDLGSCEYYPSSVIHNKNGQLVAVCGDGEYTIYTALRLKNKSFGNALDFVWSGQESNIYATRETTSKVKIYHQFKDHESIRTSFEAIAIFGGHLLGIASKDFIDFYSWDDGRIIRRIEVQPKKVYWSADGECVALVCTENFYILRFNAELVQDFISQNIETDEQGIENAFTLEQEITEIVNSGVFCGEVFLYTNDNSRLNYYIGKQIITLTHMDDVFYILGYLPKMNRIYLIDKRYNIISYELLRYILFYQAAIVREEFGMAAKIIKSKKIPVSYFNKLAQFLESQSLIEMALEMSTDIDHQFELALQLKKLKVAREILLQAPSAQKWKQLGDLAMLECDFVTVEECAKNSKDLSVLFLLYSSTSNKQRLRELSALAIEKQRYDIAFNSLFLIGDVDGCIRLLIKNNRVPEAALMARSYAPKFIPEVQLLWKSVLKDISPTAAKSLGDLESHPECFPKLDVEVCDEDKEEEVNNASIIEHESVVEVEESEVSEEKVSDVKVEEEVDVIDDVINDDVEDDVEDYVVDDVEDDVGNVESESPSLSMPSGIDDDLENEIILNGDDDDDDEFDLEELDM